jgi:hypothetical protein
MKYLAVVIFCVCFFTAAHAQKADRKKMVVGLLQLKKDMLSDTAEKVIAYFKFPLSAQILNAYFDDNDTAADSVKTTKAYFQKNYTKILNKEFFQSLKMLSFKLLETKNAIKNEVIPKETTKLSMFSYSAELKGNEITLLYLLNPNPNYKRKPGDAEDLPEYAIRWVLTYKNGHWWFTSIDAAG